MGPLAPKRKRVVVLGMMTKMPVAGVVWQTMHYMLGLERLGYEAYYVETHARTPSMLMKREDDDSAALAADFIDRTMRRFGLGGRWAFRALHDDGRCFGMSQLRLERLYDSSELILNLHGGTEPTPELAATERLVYLETDPVQLQLELAAGRSETLAFLDPHVAFFTFAENWGAADCGLPETDRYSFHSTRQPVVIDLWTGRGGAQPTHYTTVGNWRQAWRDVTYRGETYSWSKDREWRRIVELPRRTRARYELSLSSYDPGDRALLEQHGWQVRDALGFSTDEEAYRSYIAGSRGEVTVAKDQNVRFRTGWFSDRSATYLAAGRPVVTQDTGFGATLPIGTGLLAFDDLDGAVAAIERIEVDYARHCEAALEVARDRFSHDVVLDELLSAVGVELARRPVGAGDTAETFPASLAILPTSRRPTELPRATEELALSRPLPRVAEPLPLGDDGASVIVVSYDNLPFTRLCLESVLADTRESAYELIVVDNGSRDGSTGYLATVAERCPHVRVVLNGSNLGFPAACNQGMAVARGSRLVLLNNDTMVPPGWLPRLLSHLEDPRAGLVGPVTNRIGNEAEIECEYANWGEFLDFARRRAREFAGQAIAIRTPAMFCLAMRRDAFERLGPLDERYGTGLLEDDDYAERARRAGLRLLCADDALVHHFGEASFGRLVPTGEYGDALRSNQRRFLEKWGAEWEPYERRDGDGYRALRTRLEHLVSREVPPRATLLVVSRGDERLLSLGDRRALHFPQSANGVFAGHYPADSHEAIDHLESVRQQRDADYIVFPETGRWWLDHYAELRRHLDSRYRKVADREDTAVIYELEEVGG